MNRSTCIMQGRGRFNMCRAGVHLPPFSRMEGIARSENAVGVDLPSDPILIQTNLASLSEGG